MIPKLQHIWFNSIPRLIQENMSDFTYQCMARTRSIYLQSWNYQFNPSSTNEELINKFLKPIFVKVSINQHWRMLHQLIRKYDEPLSVELQVHDEADVLKRQWALHKNLALVRQRKAHLWASIFAKGIAKNSLSTRPNLAISSRNSSLSIHKSSFHSNSPSVSLFFSSNIKSN